MKVSYSVNITDPYWKCETFEQKCRVRIIIENDCILKLPENKTIEFVLQMCKLVRNTNDVFQEEAGVVANYFEDIIN